MRLVVDSRENCHILDEQKLNALHTNANSTHLEPGTYIIGIESGTLSSLYNDQPSKITEPSVLLWIHGGIVKNKKTNIKVGETWVSLNGYEDALTLEVLETTTLCCLIFDTNQTMKTGKILLSIVKDHQNNNDCLSG